MSKPLKIGLLVDGDSVPKWVESIIRRLSTEGYGEVTLIIQNQLPGHPGQIQDDTRTSQGTLWSLLSKIRRNASRLGFIAFQLLESLANRRDDRFSAHCPLSDLLPAVPV